MEIKNDKRTSIEQEIIVLLDKKYNNERYDYMKNNSYLLNGINREILENQINFKNSDFDYPYNEYISIYNVNRINMIDTIKLVIDTYLNIDGFICYYDIDILNLVLKYIKINRKLPEKEKQKPKKSDYWWFLEYFFSDEKTKTNTKQTCVKRNNLYFKHTYKNIGLNKNIINKFFFIVEEIIIPFSTYELL